MAKQAEAEAELEWTQHPLNWNNEEHSTSWKKIKIFFKRKVENHLKEIERNFWKTQKKVLEDTERNFWKKK